MKKFKAKISVFLCTMMLCAVSVSAIALNTYAEEESFIPANSVVNIEDLVTDIKADISIYSQTNKINTETYLDTDGPYTTVAVASETASLYLYSKKASDSNSEKNVNTYDGNLGLYLTSGVIKTSSAPHTGVMIHQTEDSQNKLISLRMKYDPKEEDVIGDNEEVVTSGRPQHYVFSWTEECPNWGYQRFNRIGYNWYFTTGKTFKLTRSNSTSANEITIFTESLPTKSLFDGTIGAKDVIVIYGVIEQENGTRDFYFNMTDAESGVSYYKNTCDDSEANYDSVKPDMSKLGWYSVGRNAWSWKTYVGGVNEPLVKTEPTNLTAKYNGNNNFDKQTLKDTVTLTDGYKWEDDSQEVRIGGVYRVYKEDEEYFGNRLYYNVTVEGDEDALFARHTHNIEDLVDDLSGNAINGVSGSSVKGLHIAVNSAKMESVAMNNDDGYKMSDTKTYYVYNEAAKTGINDDKNFNEYNGNISLNVVATTGTHAGISIKQTTVNSMISYRMSYDSSKNYRFGWSPSIPAWSYNNWRYQGYHFLLEGKTLSIKYTKENSSSNSADNIVEIGGDSLAGNALFDTTGVKDVTVTYGVVQIAGKICLYFKMTDGTNTYKLPLSAQTGDSDTSLSERIDVSETAGWFSVGVYEQIWQTYVGGVNEPLVCNYDYILDNDELKAGQKLSDVDIDSYDAKISYEWKDGDVELSEGTHEYDATVTVEYFGTTFTKDCKITVTAQPKDVDPDPDPTVPSDLLDHVVLAEDLVDDLSESAIRNAKTNDKGLFVIAQNVGLSEGDLNNDSGRKHNDTYTWYVYTKKAVSGSGSNTDKNLNAYDGNLSLFLGGGTGTLHSGIAIKQTAETMNSLISYRMHYDNSKRYVFSWTTACPGYGYRRYDRIGYNFYVEGTALKITYSNGGAQSDEAEIGGGSWNGTMFESNDVTVTYGAVQLEGKIYLYFKMTDGTNTYELPIESQACDSNTSLSERVDLTATAGWFSVGNNQGGWKTYVAGVNEPLVGNYDIVLDNDELREGTALSEVTLPNYTGAPQYSFKNTSETLKLGTHDYDATVTFDYFGTTVSKDCKITVTANSFYDNEATVRFVAGGVELESETVRWSNGSYQYALPDIKSEYAFGIGVGWLYGGKLYKPGASITLADGDTATVTLADLLFGVADGSAEIMSNGNGRYAVRYLLQVCTEQYELIEDYITWKFAYASADEIATTGVSRAVGNIFTLNAFYKGAYVELPAVGYSGYTALYAVRTFVTVTYEDGSSEDLYADYDEDRHCTSVIELGKKACVNGKFTADEKSAFIADCLNSVVEIVDNDGTFSVIDYEDGYEGADFVRAYKLREATQSGGTLTLKIAMDLPSGINASDVAITIYKKTAGGYEKIRIEGVAVTYENGVVTITLAYES